MATAKTVRTGASVAAFIAAVPDAKRRADCETICALLQEITGAAPEMWGDSIVGFDSYVMTYADGRTADWPIIALSPRKADLTLYLMAGFEALEADLARLGPHKRSKVCLYIKRLEDLDATVLRRLCEQSVAGMRARHHAT